MSKTFLVFDFSGHGPVEILPHLSKTYFGFAFSGHWPIWQAEHAISMGLICQVFKVFTPHLKTCEDLNLLCLPILQRMCAF
jgi:hypothetical protein